MPAAILIPAACAGSRRAATNPGAESRVVPPSRKIWEQKAGPILATFLFLSPGWDRAIAFESLKGTGFSPYVNLLKRGGFSP
jgi:hypothetical protein